MNTKRKFSWIASLVILLSILLSACEMPWSQAPASTPVVLIPTQTAQAAVPTNTAPVVQATSTVAPLATATPPASPTAPAVAGECSLTDGTVELELTKVGNEWILDPANLKPVKGYSDTRPGHDASKLEGCDLYWEYEHPEQKVHVLIVGRDDPSRAMAYLGADGKVHIPQPKGGTAVAGPQQWNSGDLSTAKPSTALEALAKRRANQLRNGYNWPLWLYLPGEVEPHVYDEEYVFGQFLTGCAELDKPTPINVAGTILADQFYASIGTEGCWVSVKIDGQWIYWQHARDNVLYNTVEAWLMPQTYTEEQVKEFIATK